MENSMTGQTAHILLVENEKTHIEQVRRAFDSHGDLFRLTVTGTLKEAQEVLAESKPELVISELILPDGRGTELLPAVGERGHFPVLFMTCQSDEHKALDAMKAGALDYVVKSEATLNAMPRVVERILRKWEHITERNRAEDALLESEARNRAILNVIPDSMFLIRKDGTFLDCKGGKKDLHMPPRKFVGKTIQDVMPPDAAIKSMRFLSEALHSNEIQVYEYQVQVESDLRHYEARMIASSGDEVVSIIRDVTNRIHREEQQRQSQKMRAITSLARGIAHEFNNMLTGIMVQADLMGMRLDQSNPLYDNVEEIKRTGKRAASLINHLQVFTGRKEFQPQVLNLNEIILRLRRTLRLFLDEGTELEDCLCPELHPIEADPRFIQQILMALTVRMRETIRNGRRFMIRTANVEFDESDARQNGEMQSGSYVMLAVSDRPVGPDEEILRHAYDPSFIKEEIGDDSDAEMSGIHNLVKANNGAIRAYSNPGGGTTFMIFFPPVEGRFNEQEQNRTVGRPEIQEQINVLLVEDNVRILNPISELLRRNGYSVLEARSGLEAIQVSARFEGRISLTITSVKMPSMSGPELASRLMASDPDMRVLYISGFPKDFVFPGGIMDFGTAILEKPFTREALLENVRRLIELPQK